MLASDPAYGTLMRRAKNKIAKIKKQLAFAGKMTPTVLAFDFKNNHGYRDKPEEKADEKEKESVIIKGKAKEWSK